MVNDFKPVNASCAIREILLFDKSMRRNRLKFENAFGVISVMKFCSKRLRMKIATKWKSFKRHSTDKLKLKCKYLDFEFFSQYAIGIFQVVACGTYSSVVSSGNSDGTVVKLFSRQSTIPSAQRHGCGQLFVPPHSSGAFSVKPINNNNSIKILH